MSLQAVLRLLYNLSFEPSNRDIMVQNGLLRKLVSLLKLPPFRAVTIRLLYHIRCAALAVSARNAARACACTSPPPPLSCRSRSHGSMDDRAKSEFTYTEAVPLVMQLIIHFPAVSAVLCGGTLVEVRRLTPSVACTPSAAGAGQGEGQPS